MVVVVETKLEELVVADLVEEEDMQVMVGVVNP